MTHHRARLTWTIGALALIAIGTFVASLLARGYRPSQGELVAGNGLLAVSSQPKGARVLLDGQLLGVTDDTFYIKPGEYTVRFESDGLFPYEKQIKIEETIVTSLAVTLFPQAPSLSPLTLAGANMIRPSPDGQRLFFQVEASGAATLKPGFYLLELTDSPLSFTRGPRLIAAATNSFPLGTSDAVWSPDSTQVVILGQNRAALLDPTRTTDLNQVADISNNLPTLWLEWETDIGRRDAIRLAKFPLEIQAVATASAKNVVFSPDEKMLLYTATADFTLPDNLLPAKPGSNSQPQARRTKAGNIYVYDREEDRQFYLAKDPTSPDRSKKLIVTPATASAKLANGKWLETAANYARYHSPAFTHGYQWFPTSRHLVHSEDNSLIISEYDGQNPVSVYAGPFDDEFFYPWPNGARLIIRTTLTPGAGGANLYTVDL